MKKRKTLRRTAKGLMLSAMSLLAATGMMVNAYTYDTGEKVPSSTIRIEHVWEDNNNELGKRPDQIKENVIQTEVKPNGDKDSIKEEITDKYPVKESDDSDKPITDENGYIVDNGSEAGKDYADDKGYQDGLDAAGKLEDEDREDLPAEPEDPRPQKEPEEPAGRPSAANYNHADPIEHQKYQEQYKKDLAEYEASDAYQQYLKDKGVWDAWQQYDEDVKDAAESYQPEGDKGFDKGFSEGIDSNKDVYDSNFSEGFLDGVNGKTPDAIDEEKRKEDIELIEGTLNDELKDTDIDINEKEMAENIVDAVDRLIEETAPGNLWEVEGSVDRFGLTEKNEAGNPFNYDAVISEESLKELEAAGYETTKMQVKVTLVAGKDGVVRTYVSIDKGDTWHPADDVTREWDENNNATYNPAAEYVTETVISFLHTLKEAPPPPPPEEIPGDDDDDDDDDVRGDDDDDDDDDVPPPPSEKPKDPEPEVPEPEVPLAEAEPEPEEPPVEEELPEPEVPLAPMEEEVPEPNVPLAEVPATGDSLLYWMSAAALSGAALLLLNKREKEDAEA